MASEKPKTLKARLKDGEDTLYGLFLVSFSPTIAEIAGHAGFDFVVIDMEHGHGGLSDALPCLHALAASQTPVILRLPESSPTWVKKALDIGPQGLMFPMIDDPDSAQKVVSYCWYPPAGIRGAAFPAVRASKFGFDEEYLSKCEKELLIMCQVESVEAASKVKEIAAVDGVDCIMIGPLDMSASMGYLSDPGNEKVKKLLKETEKAVLDMKAVREASGGTGAFLAGFEMPHDGPGDLKRRGYQMVCGAVDVLLFKNAAVADVQRFKTMK